MTTDLVDSEGVIRFFQRLSNCFRYPGVVYLVGGSSLILVAAKPNTFDIDIQFEISPEHQREFIRCLRQVSRELKFPVEHASPDHFIPLPGGYQDRRRFLGRFGQLDVFHFDFYSVALSKIHRGNEKDFADVLAMLNQGIIIWEVLTSYFQEILPRYEELLTAHPDEYQRKFSLLETRFRAG
jgi:hypothetical protein